ncbi:MULTISPECIES: Ku protein [unclassified Streptomyces]|uniref:Ku protein n=1 Tax=unclassified Streptomyces TaxID=2593676 RepID=UPI002F91A7E9
MAAQRSPPAKKPTVLRNTPWFGEVSYGEMGRGYEMPDGRVIPVSDEELRALPLPRRAIELIAFIPAADVDAIRISPGYYR